MSLINLALTLAATSIAPPLQPDAHKMVTVEKTQPLSMARIGKFTYRCNYKHAPAMKGCAPAAIEWLIPGTLHYEKSRVDLGLMDAQDWFAAFDSEVWRYKISERTLSFTWTPDPYLRASWRFPACSAVTAKVTWSCSCTPTTWYRDSDRDGKGNPAATRRQCERPSGDWVTVAGDDCDGLHGVFARRTWYLDSDNDDRGTAGATTMACTQPRRYVAVAGDQCDGVHGIYVPRARATATEGTAHRSTNAATCALSF